MSSRRVKHQIALVAAGQTRMHMDRPAGSGATSSPTAGWQQIPSGGPSARQQASGVWTGSQTIIWGGDMQTDKGLRPLGDGKIYKP